MPRVVLASGNAGKLRELEAILAPLQVELVAQSAFDVEEAEETGTTFVENAIIKARNAALVTGLPAIADDSGLEVDALDGHPGVRSSRFAGDLASDADNVALLLERMQEYPSDGARRAAFRCVIVYLRSASDPMPLIASGSWHGRIAHAPSGADGFGYDPVFFDEQHGCTAAELPRAEKNRISHRARALAELLPALKQHTDGPA